MYAKYDGCSWQFSEETLTSSLESEISKLCIFTSNFCLVFDYSVCDGGLFTCTNESCDGESCVWRHTLTVDTKRGPTLHFNYSFKFLLYKNYWLNLQRNFRRNKHSCNLWAINVPLGMKRSERNRVWSVYLCVSGLWMEQLVSVELLFRVLRLWTAVLQSDDTAPASVQRTGVWGAVTHLTSLQGPRMWWETQCESSTGGLWGFKTENTFWFSVFFTLS